MKRALQSQGLFGRYLLLEQLGQGGMAQIWRARPANQADAREVVVKTLHPRLLGQPLFAELFRAEARITKLLSHPGIVRIVDDGVVKGMPYLAMERVDGLDLAALFRSLPAGRRAPVEVVLAIAIEMCRAIGFAHAFRDARGRARPVIHGDLSPSNLMVRRDGGVTLIDFGVAHMDARIARGRAHLVIGKSGYFAPELLDGAPADARSDVFSAGVVLHELLAGKQLFVVESERETLRRLSEAPIPPPSRSNLRVTPAIDEIVLRALDRDPARRFASANELGAALARVPAPERALRDEVADFVRSVFAGAPRCDEPITAPIAPCAPPRLAAAAALLPHESTATRNGRRPRRPSRRSGGGVARVTFAAALLFVAMLAPLPHAPAGWFTGWWPLGDAQEAPPTTPTRPTAPTTLTLHAPAVDAPAATATVAQPRHALSSPAKPTQRHHAKQRQRARARRSVASGSLVDPFVSR